MSIHPTAIVDSHAELDSSVEVGPFCTVGPHVKIGAGSKLLSHVVVANRTTLGARTVVHPHAVVGAVPQDLKFSGEPSELIVGEDCTIRENATLNIGTEGGEMKTVIGDGCLLMACSHVAHDCIVGEHTILANSAALAGHVEVGPHVIFGGMAGVHQFCRIGAHAFIAAGAMVNQDVPPFCVVQGDRAQLVGLNVVGLRRAGWNRERIQAAREGFRELFFTHRTRLLALERVEEEHAAQCDDVKTMCAFIRSSQRGVCGPRVAHPPADYEGT